MNNIMLVDHPIVQEGILLYSLKKNFYLIVTFIIIILLLCVKNFAILMA